MTNDQTNKTHNVIVIAMLAMLLPFLLKAQENENKLSPKNLKSLSMKDLMNIEVTSVNRIPEKLFAVASAIQVVTGEDMLKYGASNIPEALSLAGNLQVAQSGSHAWGVSARGFNTELANKLLVLMDGRTVYTPLYSGVFWDRQDYLLEDVKQIEVISGPGGTLWGANAVNGVINITTKKADETQGLYVEGATGNELKALAGLRYGGKIDSDMHYRIYTRYGKRDGVVFSDSTDSNDSWNTIQGGFRIDKDRKQSTFTIQGDMYKNQSDLITGGTSEVIGGNVLGRWVHTFSDNSEIRLQTYYDRTDFDLPTASLIIDGNEIAPSGNFKDKLVTYDIDFQHHFKLGRYNQIVWGMGFRNTHDRVSNSPSVGFLPTELKQNLFSVFLQDEINIYKSLFLTLGSKLEHNDYTGFEVEPSLRIRQEIGDNWMVWAAISRAVRVPSRVDRDITQGTPPYLVLLSGNPEFRSETVIAEEIGFRGKIGGKATTSISFFYNQYDYIRSTELEPDVIFPLSFHNGLMGETYGAEVNITYQVADWWKLTTSYNLLREDIRVKEGKTDINNALNETADPEGQFLFRSSFELPFGISVNGSFRWVDDLPINNSGEQETVPSYSELDGMITWKTNKNLALSIAGRNLLNKEHVEYGIARPTQQAIQRSVYIKFALTL